MSRVAAVVRSDTDDSIELTAALELETLLDIAEAVVSPAILREEPRGSQAR